MTSLLIELLLLAGAAVSPRLPPPWSALALAGCLALWLALKPPRREVWVAGLALFVAVLLLGYELRSSQRARAPEGEWVEEARSGYAAVWSGLQQEARGAARALGRTPQDAADRLAAFRRLAETEGIIPALEPSHALARVAEVDGELVVVCLSGRGDKDLAEAMERL